MTKHDPAILAQAKNDADAASATVAPAPTAPEAAKPDADKKHGPSTTMKSGWASGGSAAG